MRGSFLAAGKAALAVLAVASAPGLYLTAAAASPAVAGATTAAVSPATSLLAVSCRSASWCMTVGAAANRLPFAGRWNGSSWQGLATHAPAKRGELTGISCLSQTKCVAVGWHQTEQGLAETWNGRRWQVSANGLPQANLSAVSCPAAGFCMAVGHSFGGGHLIAASWNGSTWQQQAVPAPADANVVSLAKVSCTGPANCLAVGSYATLASQGSRFTLAEQWDGGSWQLLSEPDLGQGSHLFTSVSCPSQGDCLAVGTSETSDGSASAVAQGWDGSSWTVLPAVPQSSGLAAVSCPQASHCIAIGYPAAGQGTVIQAESWNGTLWTKTALPTPAADQLPALSCPAAASCMAVGTSEDPAGVPPYSSALTDSLDSHGWRQVRVSPFSVLNGVACRSAAWCMAVGGHLDAHGNVAALAERWDGASWHSLGFPGDGPAQAISCPGTGFCMATTDDESFRWNGTRWQLAGTVPGGFLRYLSCTGATFCMVSGNHTTQTWDGTHWHSIASPPSAVAGLSCARRTFCVAIGEGLGDRQDAEAWNGHQWRHMSRPRNDARLSGVSCLSTVSCMAVGAVGNGADTVAETAERWNGTTWLPLTMPGTAGTLAVSCSGRSACMAAGTYFNKALTMTHDQAERWNGTTWQLVKTALPGGNPTPVDAAVSGSGLQAVSCTSASRCVAVGQAKWAALAEAWNGGTWRQVSP